jgi:hypothetical protein
MTNVSLHIERLVLEGLPVGTHEGPLVQAAIEAELARLFADGALAGTGLQGRTVPLVRAEPMALAGMGGGEALGTQIGQAIYGGIGR